MSTLSSIVGTARFLWGHPVSSRDRVGAFRRWVSWQVASRLLPGPSVIDFVEGTSLLVQRGMTGATGSVYVGLHEFSDMAFLLHLLREGDDFIDIGANVGTYSVLAAGVSGARVVALEPVPTTFRALESNIRLNRLDNEVTTLNVGAASNAGVLRFTSSLDTVNHVSVERDEASPCVEVQVRRLDDLIDGRRPVAMKIDVEGFEWEVFRGAPKTLADPSLLALVTEMNGSGERYGHQDAEVEAMLSAAGFVGMQYDAFERRLHPVAKGPRTSGNVIFVRDLQQVEARLQSARKFEVRGVTF